MMNLQLFVELRIESFLVCEIVHFRNGNFFLIHFPDFKMKLPYDKRQKITLTSSDK